MLLGTLGASLLGSLLTGKRIKKPKIARQGVMRTSKETIRIGQDF